MPQRGSLTLWVTPEALAAWQAPLTGRRGRPPHDSDLALETGHLLRLALGRSWRPTEGLLRSSAGLLGVSLAIPDHTTFSRCRVSLSLPVTQPQMTRPVDVIMDSTGLKVYGAGEWQREKHGERGRRRWRQLHWAIDPNSPEILASELATHDVGDLSKMGPLLEQVPGVMVSVTADGAYAAAPGYQAIAARQPPPAPAVILPPRATAVLSSQADVTPSWRDRQIQIIQEKGRRSWERVVGYGKRSLVETALFRYQSRIGPTLRARTLPAQKTEARVACSVIRRMALCGMPVSQRV